MASPDLTRDPFMIDARQSIDHFDTAFLHLLYERMRLVHRIIALKERLQLDLKPSDARKEDMRDLIEMSVQLKLEPRFFKTVLDLVFQDAIAQHQKEGWKADENTEKNQPDNASLEDLRDSLLNLDKTICLVLAERFRIVKRIGRYKQQLGIPPLDASRWQQLLADKAEKAGQLGISVSLVENIFNAIHEIALVLEEDVKQG